MLSKQEKQKYGEILRQQMKEKQERKKLQEIQKRGHIKLLQPPRENPPVFKQIPLEKQNSYQRPFVDPKQQLQKKLETQEYNYFGGAGGGAPNRRMPENNANNLRNFSQPTNLRIGADQMMQFSGNGKQHPNQYQFQSQQRVRTLSQQDQFYQGQNMQNQMQSISPQSINYPRQVEGGYYQDTGVGSVPIGRTPNPYQMQPLLQNYQQYNNGQASNREEPRQQISYELIPQNKNPLNNRQEQYTQQNQYQPTQNYSQTNQIQLLNQFKHQIPSNLHPVQNHQMLHHQMEDSTNQELQEVYKKGGRNLLKLENQTIDEHMIKQKRKLEIQKQLKQQIQQAERRKKEEKERLKRQQEEEERKHMAYLAEQKRKLQEEQRKTKQAQQKIIQQNRRNQQLRIQMQEEAKRKTEQQKANKQRIKNQNMRLQEQQKRQQEELQKVKLKKYHESNQNSRTIVKPSPRITEDDNSSVISSETSELEKGFNTAMSKEFFRKERQRKNPSSSDNQEMKKVTQQIKKMNYEIMQQRKQFTKVINEREIAEIQKRKAIQQVERLKMQLKKKMDDDNQKLLRALQADYRNNDFDKLPPQNYKNLNENQVNSQNYENQYPKFTKKPMRQRQQEQLVQKQYQPKPPKYIQKEQETNRFEQSNVGLISLDGESKKIPLFLEHSDNLTMSQVQDFAKDSAFFQKGLNNRLNHQSSAKQKYNARINESIAEEADEDRDYVNNKSRQSNRNKQTKKESSIYRNQQDELDKLIDSRAKSRGGWGEMSSVNSDITRQIDELLKKKQNGMGNSNGRPSSISNAGKHSLSKQGYAYDGLTLNSNVGGTLGTNGTLDLDRINGRNEARLKQLKNLGVQTINTNGDDDLNTLDRLLNKYKAN